MAPATLLRPARRACAVLLSCLAAVALPTGASAQGATGATQWAACHMYASGGVDTPIARIVFEPFQVARTDAYPKLIVVEYQASGELAALLPGYRQFETFGTTSNCDQYDTLEAAQAESVRWRTSQNYSIVKTVPFRPSAKATGLGGGKLGAKPGSTTSGSKSGAPTPSATPGAPDPKTIIAARKQDAAAAVLKVAKSPAAIARNIAVFERRAKQRVAKAPRKNPLSKEKASTLSDPATCVSQPVIRPNPSCNGKGVTGQVTNSCPQPVDVRMCFFTTTDKWDCRVKWGVASGSDWSQSACFGTSRVFTSLRNSGAAGSLRQPP